MPKLWICGICQNNEEELKEILAPFCYRLSNQIQSNIPYALHTLWVDGGSTDGTLDTITRNSGYWCKRKWTNDHDFQMNQYLRAGHIKHGDWVIQLDTSERLNPDFIDTLQRNMLSNFEAQGINTVYQRSKILMFRYHDDQIFLGSPHWGLQAQRHHMVDIAKFDGFQDDKSYCWSLRDNVNKWIVNGIKYYYAYGRSNHMWLVYNTANYPGTTNEFIREHEQVRQRFRDYCRNELGLPLHGSTGKIMAGLDEYLKNLNFTQEFVKFMNFEKFKVSRFFKMTSTKFFFNFSISKYSFARFLRSFNRSCSFVNPGLLMIVVS